MKNIKLLLYILALITCACRKESTPPKFATVNVVNAAIGAASFKVNYFGKPISWANYTGAVGNLAFGTSQILTGFTLSNNYPLQIVTAADSTKFVFNQTIELSQSESYSLYITGQTGNYESILKTEIDIPYNLSDSVVSVRFINLSPNSPTVNITLASTPLTKEVADLTYKQITNFKTYPIRKVIPAGTVTWQVRDAITNAILTSYTLPATVQQPYTTVSASLSRFKSVTLAIKGLVGATTGANAYSVFPIPAY